jgi:hypothetical protein
MRISQNLSVNSVFLSLFGTRFVTDSASIVESSDGFRSLVFPPEVRTTADDTLNQYPAALRRSVFSEANRRYDVSLVENGTNVVATKTCRRF